MKRSSWYKRSNLCGAALVMAGLALAACAGPAPNLRAKPQVELVWPNKPQQAKIQWVRTVHDYQDAGISKGFWKKTLEFFIGADPHHIVRPYGVLSDGADRFFIADPGAGMVHWMDLKDGRYTIIGEQGEHKLRTPIGLTLDQQKRLYITDSTTGGVYRYDPLDNRLHPFPVQMLRRPTGIAYNQANGLLYLVDTLANEVVGVTTEGVEKVRFGASERDEAHFNHPTDIWADQKGQLYVTDPLNYKIKAFTPEGRLLFQIGNPGDGLGSLNKPKGVAVDSEGHIYVSDALMDAVQVFDDQGQFLLSFGSTGTEDGQFWMPSGIYIDDKDYLFVADSYNRRIQVFRYLSGKDSGNGAPDNAAPAVR